MAQEETKPRIGSRGPVRLYNRADGVRGHYCIGREVFGEFGSHHEFWHTNRFCSAGEVVVGEAAAKEKLVEIVQRLARDGEALERAGS
jgi:hypothetical protein